MTPQSHEFGNYLPLGWFQAEMPCVTAMLEACENTALSGHPRKQVNVLNVFSECHGTSAVQDIVDLIELF